MQNSYRFFENKACKYYPCHKGIENLNCLFCYCPLYHMDCTGNYRYIKKGDRQIKECTDCVFPHIPGNYERIIRMLSEDHPI